MRKMVFVTLLFASAVLTGAQSKPVPARFDTVQIRASNTSSVDVVALDCTGRCTAGLIDQGSVVFGQMTMLRIIAAAYDVKVTSIAGGPNWLATDRFDIYAKSSTATTRETLLPMLQALLSERLGLKIHWETRPMPAYVLSVSGDKPRLREASAAGPGSCKAMPNAGVVSLACEKQTMTGLTSILNNTWLPEPVSDATGLQGAYDFTLTFRPIGSLIRAQSDARYDPSTDVSIFDALTKLGLKLERQMQPAQVLVVDRINHTPGIEAAMSSDLPTVPSEFEVAEVRPTQPDAAATSDRYLPGGQIELHGWTLQRLIKLAYDISDNEALVGAPKWLNSDRFDVLAKSLPIQEFRVARAANGLTNVAPGMYAEMMRKVLAQHFKLAVHPQVQPITVFALTVPARGSKLKEGSSTSRTMCTDTTPAGGLETYTCENITIAQFAPNLRAIAPVYLGAHAVVDLTGLKGAYDLTLKWHWAALVNVPVNLDANGLTPDPTGYTTLFDALEKQLGLKVVVQKHPMRVVVIDHVERVN